MLKVTVDDSTFQAGLRDVAKAGRDLASAFRRLRKPMREDQEAHAREEKGPDGAWPARKTRVRSQKMFAKVKRSRGQVSAEVFRYGGLLGALPDIIQIKAFGATVFARSPIKWARAHADGDTVGRGARLPERPFLWVSDDLADKASKILNSHLEKAWSGRRGRGRARGRARGRVIKR